LEEGKTSGDLDAWRDVEPPPWAKVVEMGDWAPDELRPLVAEVDEGTVFLVCYTAAPEAKVGVLGPIEVWDLRGPAGPPGPPGPAGPPGPPGSADTAGALTFYRVMAEVTIAPGGVAQALAMCDQGDIATGGGFWKDFDVVVAASRPMGTTPRGWQVDGISQNPTGTQLLIGYAVCADVWP
jgi:hypothetical protein